MSGRFPEPAVVRRQIIEGVLAIVRMDTSGFTKGKIGVQIFDRRGGASNVQFNGTYRYTILTTLDLLFRIRRPRSDHGCIACKYRQAEPVSAGTIDTAPSDSPRFWLQRQHASIQPACTGSLSSHSGQSTKHVEHDRISRPCVPVPIARGNVW